MPLRALTPELSRAFRQAGAWQDVPLCAVIDEVAEQIPEKLAVADQHEQLSYRALVTRSRHLAAWLVGRGLRPGTPVALQCANRVALAITHLACDRADLVFLPLSHMWRRTEVSHLLLTSCAEVLIVSGRSARTDYLGLAQQLRPELPSLRLVGSLDGAGGDFDFAEACSAEWPAVTLPRDADAPRFVMATSGTTDIPHMSLWSDNNIWFFLRTFIDAVAMRPGDLAVAVAPADTGSTGYMFAVLAPLLAGASSQLLERWSPPAALDLIEKTRATHVTAVPTQVVKLLQETSIRGRDFSALRVLTSAGSAMPPATAQSLESVLGCVLHVSYGASDGGVPAMLRITDPPDKRYHTVGRPIQLTDLMLVNENMKPVATGNPGEVLWRNPTQSFGYLNDPARTDAAFWGDGWYRSGDIGQLDTDGYLSIVGRSKDLIIRGGQNISPGELESLIQLLPAVSEVAVVGVPDPVYGERACACVVPGPGASLTFEDLVTHLLGQDVAPYKLPERMEVFDELPKSAGGKIRKVDLRRLISKRPERPELRGSHGAN